MDAKSKELIELRVKLNFYQKLDKKIEQVLNCELELADWSEEVYKKISVLETEIDNLKVDMDLPDEQWDEDEILP